MRFVVRMTVRELRSSWRRLVFFFVCVAIGVGAIVAMRSVIQSVRGGLVREARAMLAADVIISTNRPWAPDVRRQIEERLALAPVQARTEAVETATMVRAEGRTRGQDGGVARRPAGISLLRRDRAGRRTALLARPPARPRGDRTARTARSAWGQAGGCDPHWRPAVHGARRSVEGAGPAYWSLHLWIAGLRRLRRPATERSAGARQPRELPDPPSRRAVGRRVTDPHAARASSATGSSTRGRTDRQKTTSAKTWRGRRTT